MCPFNVVYSAFCCPHRPSSDIVWALTCSAIKSTLCLHNKVMSHGFSSVIVILLSFCFMSHVRGSVTLFSEFSSPTLLDLFWDCIQDIQFFFSLAFSVTIFCSEAFVAIFILLIRRSKVVGGELGGPKVFKYITALLLVLLWMLYLLLSTLEVYDVIEGF